MIFVDPKVGETKSKSRAVRLQALLAALADLGVEAEPLVLSSGDFMFLGNGPDGLLKIGVELKTVPDFISSMVNGHLADQVTRMVDDGYQRIYVIVEGFYRAKRPSGQLEVPRGRSWKPLQAGPRPIFWDDVERFITSLEESGIRVRKTRTPVETARTLARVLFGFWSKDYDDHSSLDVLYRPQVFSLVREDETTRRVRQVAACLPAIGVGRSKSVAGHFRSIKALINASEHDWLNVPGVGAGIAKKVVESVEATCPVGRQNNQGRGDERSRRSVASGSKRSRKTRRVRTVGKRFLTT